MYTTKMLADENLTRGYQLGDYSLLELIGRGGEGVVWSAWDNRRQRVVAMKILPTAGEDPTILSMASRDFERQVHLLASLEHPGILPLYEFGTTEAHYYFVMRYNCVGSLASRLLGGPMPLPQVLQVAAQMAASLSYLHTRAIIHRDLKPNNILMDSQERVFLSDFGLAKQLSQETLPFHTGRGTGPYAPYEQHIQMSMSPQSDVYSMGIVIYEMLTGHLPWEGMAFLAIQQKQEGMELPDVRETDPTLPAGLTAVLRRLTAFNYRDRPPTALDAFNLLLTAVPDLPPAWLAELKKPLPTVSEEVYEAQDARFLLQLLMAGWHSAEEEFPARLTHLAFIDAASRHDGRYRLALDESQKAFMLRGAFTYDYRVDYWWRQAADPAIQVRVCEETMAQEEVKAATRALTRLSDVVSQHGTPFPLAPATFERLIDMAMGVRGWAMRDNALKVLAAASPLATQWQPVGITPTGDVKLAELALDGDAHAAQAAALVGRVRSETAVQTILGAAPQTDDARFLQTMQRIRAAAGGLPRLVPARIRLRVWAARWRQRLFEDKEGLSVPRVAMGLLVGIFASVLMAFGLFSRPAAQMRDVLLAPYPVSGIITIVAVDDASIARYGRWSAWSRALHADLIEQLTAAGARAIAFDFLFDTPSTDPEADERLAAAMRAAGMVVQPVLAPGDGFHEIPGAVRFDGRILPYAHFLAASAAVGSTNVLHDEDGYVRRIPTVVAIDQERYLNLPLATLLVYLNGGPLPGKELPSPQNNHLFVAGRRIPVGASGEMNIYYAGPPARQGQHTFQTVSYADVLDGRFAPELFQNKIVLVGITATSEPDTDLTPVGRGRPMYGVEILANTLESIWSEQFIVSPGLPLQMAVLLLLGVLTGLACARPGSGLLLALGLAVLYFVFAMLIFDARAIMLDLLYPFMTIFFSYAVVSAYRYSLEVRRRREMMQLFAANVTPDVARGTIEAVRRGEINLGGQVQEISVLIVDIRGYRPFAEWHEPGVVMTMMNDLRSLICGVVLEFAGTIAPHEGEQVMAIFNAPLPQADHAWRAIETAFTLRERLQLHKAALPEDHLHRVVQVGYGIFTGRAIVGNAGVASHFTYTAMGDSVVLASHLAEHTEANEVFIGEPTYEKVSDLITVEPLPPLLVKERSTPLSLYLARGPASG